MPCFSILASKRIRALLSKNKNRCGDKTRRGRPNKTASSTPYHTAKSPPLPKYKSPQYSTHRSFHQHSLLVVLPSQRQSPLKREISPGLIRDDFLGLLVHHHRGRTPVHKKTPFVLLHGKAGQGVTGLGLHAAYTPMRST